MVFDPQVAPKGRVAFIMWFNIGMDFPEPEYYEFDDEDPTVYTQPLQM